MTLPQALHSLGALVVLAVGLYGFLRIEGLAERVGIRFADDGGTSEARAIFGGLLAGAALFALWAQDGLVFAALGAGFLGATLARWVDLARRPSRVAWVGLFADVTVAALLLAPSG